MGGLRVPFLPEASAGGHSHGRHRPRAKCDRRVIRFGRATAHRAASRQVYYSFCSSYPSVGLSRFIREFAAISARPRSVSVFNHIAHTVRSSFFVISIPSRRKETFSTVKATSEMERFYPA